MGFQAKGRQGCLGQTWRGAHCARKKKGDTSEPWGEGRVGREKGPGLGTSLSEGMSVRGGQQEAAQESQPQSQRLLPRPFPNSAFLRSSEGRQSQEMALPLSLALNLKKTISMLEPSLASLWSPCIATAHDIHARVSGFL